MLDLLYFLWTLNIVSFHLSWRPTILMNTFCVLILKELLVKSTFRKIIIRSTYVVVLWRGLGGLWGGWLEAGTAHGPTADAAAGQSDHHRDHDLKLTLLTVRQVLLVLHLTHPFNEENWKCKNHWLILAVVQVFHVGLIFLQVVSPSRPGTKDHDGSPDKHDKVDDGHHSAGHLVHSHPNLLSAVNLPVPLGTLLVNLGPGVDGCEDWYEDDIQG